MRKYILSTLITGLLVASAAWTEELSVLSYIDHLPKPVLMGGVGNSHLEITTEDPEAQKFFDQGVSLLHDFWWFESYRSFLRASQLDPEAAMPHWGLYMAASNMANLTGDERSEALDSAISAMRSQHSKASNREQYYLDAVIALHEGEGDEAVTKHNNRLVALLNEYPDQIEARLFLWTMLDTGYDGKGTPKPEQLYGQLLLEREFKEHGDHQGLLHYWIHSQEPGAHPESALKAAQRLARLAPNSGHIVHMPGHIHYLMGNYGRAHEQFTKAESADLRYMDEYGIEAIFTWNYLHNFSFIMSNLAEAGRLADGAVYAEKLATLTEESSFRHLPHFEMLLGRAIMEQAYMALRLEQFDLAAELIRDSRWDDWEKSEGLLALQEAYYAYSAGMAAAQNGDVDAAEGFSRALDSILWRSQRDEASLHYRRKPLEIAALELQGWVAARSGDIEGAKSLLKRAVALEDTIEYGEPRANIHPAAESLGRIQLDNGDLVAARESYQSVLAERPNAGLPLFGIARSFEIDGDETEARKRYKMFLSAWEAADQNLPQVIHARQYMESQ